ncbi:hypothetical protein [Pseudomonas cerasi]
MAMTPPGRSDGNFHIQGRELVEPVSEGKGWPAETIPGMRSGASLIRSLPPLPDPARRAAARRDILLFSRSGFLQPHQLDGQLLTVYLSTFAGEAEAAHAGREAGIVINFLIGFIFINSYQHSIVRMPAVRGADAVIRLRQPPDQKQIILRG